MDESEPAGRVRSEAARGDESRGYAYAAAVCDGIELVGDYARPHCASFAVGHADWLPRGAARMDAAVRDRRVHDQRI